MERNMLYREINTDQLNRDSEFGNPNRTPSGTLDDKVIISWENQTFAKRGDGFKRVYAVINTPDGSPRKATFNIKVSNTGSSKYTFFNKFFIARLFYETASGQDSDCRASAGLNCIKWADGNYHKKVPLANHLKTMLSALMSGTKQDIKAIDNIFIEIPADTLKEAYNKVESQILEAKKLDDGRTLNGKVYLEITFYWQEYSKGRWYSGTFSNFQSKPITMTFFPVKPVYFIINPNKVPITKLLGKSMKDFKDKYSSQIGVGVSTATTVNIEIGKVAKSEVSAGMEKSLQISSEIKSSTTSGLKTEVTIPVLDFIKLEGSTSKTTEETEGIVNAYTQTKSFMEGMENSLQQSTTYGPDTKKGSKRRFYMIPILQPLNVKSILYTPVNRFGFATARIASSKEDVFLKITGWDLEQQFFK